MKLLTLMGLAWMTSLLAAAPSYSAGYFCPELAGDYKCEYSDTYAQAPKAPHWVGSNYLLTCHKL